jgi:predicted amidohydrolase
VKVVAAALQTGPLFSEKEKNDQYNLNLIDKASRSEADFILLPELCNIQFFCVGLKDKSFFKWADPVPGSTVELYAKKSLEYDCCIILPIFEKGEVEGEYYDSAVVLEKGELVEGVLPTGKKVRSARKNYISDFKWSADQINDEKFYFRTGNGHPIFKTRKAKIGILICYERWYPEAWRVLSLMGGEIVFTPNASAGYVSDMASCILRANAAMNSVFCVGVNKVGTERVHDTETRYYGLSTIVDPKGKVLAQAGEGQQESIVSAAFDTDEIISARQSLFSYRDRRPEFYELISRS